MRVRSRVGVYLERRIDHFLITPGDFQGATSVLYKSVGN